MSICAHKEEDLSAPLKKTTKRIAKIKIKKSKIDEKIDQEILMTKIKMTLKVILAPAPKFWNIKAAIDKTESAKSGDKSRTPNLSQGIPKKRKYGSQTETKKRPMPVSHAPGIHVKTILATHIKE